MNLNEYTAYLLSRRDYSLGEFLEKCNRKFPEQLEDIERVIKSLSEKGYLSDEKFTQNFIRSEWVKKNGRQKIYQKLLLKKVDKELIENSLSAFFEVTDITPKLTELAEKKKAQVLKKHPDISKYELNNKVMSFLVGRGFSYDEVKQVL